VAAARKESDYNKTMRGCLSMLRNKIISFILLLTSLLAVTASCASENANVPAVSDTAAETSAETEVLRENYPDTLPAELDFEGSEVKIFFRSDSPWYEEMYAEQNGEVVNDAVYMRNSITEERLNVKLNFISEPGIGGNTNTFLNKIRASVQANDNAYDLVAGYAYHVTSLATEKLFVNLLNVPYLNFEQPWWTQDMVREMNINGNLYFMTGDLSLTMTQMMQCFFFNKKLAEDWSTGDLYSAVLNGEWTVDKLQEITADVYSDLNGDGIADINDLYGYTISDGNHIDAFAVGFNQLITARGDDDLPVMELDTEKSVLLVNRLYSLLYETQGVLAYKSQDNIAVFTSDRALFASGDLRWYTSLRDMESDFGIIPFPKWDADQEKYQTLVQDAYSLFSIPVTCQNLDLLGATCEAMAAQSYRTLTPTFYEIALKNKYTRDSESSMTLDLIRDGCMFNFGFVNSNSMGNPMHIFRELIEAKKTDFVSLYKSKEKSYNKALEKLLNAYLNIA
jgi:hypothetical protein